MTHDDDTLATKGDLERSHVARGAELRGEMNRMKDEILRHFDVVVEYIRHDLEGAHRDEIEMLEDGKEDREQRVMKLEQIAELRV